MPTLLSLECDAGESVQLTLDCCQADGETPLSLSGATVAVQVALGTAVVIPAIAITPVVTNAQGGVVNIVIPGSATAGLAGVYIITVRVTLANGIITDQASGTLTINQTAFG